MKLSQKPLKVAKLCFVSEHRIDYLNLSFAAIKDKYSIKTLKPLKELEIQRVQKYELVEKCY